MLDKCKCLEYNKHIRLYFHLKYYVKDVSQMKNVLKKIAATAMAFTLLGAGTAITKTVSPKSDNTLVASACNCNARRYASTKQVYTGFHNEPITKLKWDGHKYVTIVVGYSIVNHYKTVPCIRCVNCGAVQ